MDWVHKYKDRWKLQKVNLHELQVNCYCEEILYTRLKTFLERHLSKYTSNNYLLKEVNFFVVSSEILIRDVKERFFQMYPYKIKLENYLHNKLVKTYTYKDRTIFLPHFEHQDQPVFIRDGSNYFFVLNSLDVPDWDLYILDTITELYIAHHTHKEGILYHASAVALDSKGIAIVGAAGKGKTTLMMHLIHNGHAKPMSDDRVLIKERKIYYLPSPVLLTKELLKHFHNLEQTDIRMFGSRYMIPLEPILISYNIKEHPSQADLKAIIIPNFDISYGDKLTVESIHEEEALHILFDQCLSPREVWRDMYLLPYDKDQDAYKAHCLKETKSLVSKNICLRISFGPKTDFQYIKELLLLEKPMDHRP